MQPDEDIPPPTNPPPIQQQIRSIYEQWLAPYRGLTPHSIRHPAPNADVYTDEPDTFGDTEETITLADPKRPPYESIIAIPVVIRDDITGINRSTDTYHIAYQEAVTTQPKMIISRDVTRTNGRIANNGPGIVYIGDTESTGTTGYPMAVNEAFEIHGTRDYWAVQASGQANPAVLGIYVEHEREIE